MRFNYRILFYECSLYSILCKIIFNRLILPGEPSKLDTVSGITTEDLEAELEMDLDNLKLDDIDTTDVNLDDEELLED